MWRLALVALLIVGAFPARSASEATAVAIFAGGCFWCIEQAFEDVPGVISAETGYIGGALASPTDREVATGTTGHFEAARVTYRPAEVSYRRLLDLYMLSVDPTDAGGQFCERGPSKRTAIFVSDPTQKAEATAIAARAEAALGRPVVTQILPATEFWPAEAYHQDYARRNPQRYDFYRRACDRDAGLQRLWGAAPAFASGP